MFVASLVGTSCSLRTTSLLWLGIMRHYENSLATNVCGETEVSYPACLVLVYTCVTALSPTGTLSEYVYIYILIYGHIHTVKYAT